MSYPRRKAVEMNHADVIAKLAKHVGFPIMNKSIGYGDYHETGPELMPGLSVNRVTLEQKVNALLEHLGLTVVVDRKAKCVKRSSRGDFPAGRTVVAKAPALTDLEEANGL